MEKSIRTKYFKKPCKWSNLLIQPYLMSLIMMRARTQEEVVIEKGMEEEVAAMQAV